jgi:hypothetical protein
LRPWLALERTHGALNAAAQAAGLRTEGGKPVRFVAPAAKRGPYELRVHETGCVETRPDNLHDWFNALCWLAFPRTKARINAMHAAEIPHEGGRRGRLRDLLTIFDEGGAIVVCGDDELNRLVRAQRWKELFWGRRQRVQQAMRFVVLGHAVLEQALAPWPGITCKALFARADQNPDDVAAAWLAACPQDASPRHLAALPLFGYPGWADNGREEFYDDARYFRETRGNASPARRARSRGGAR